MENSFFTDRTEIELRAFFLGKRLNMKAIEQSQRITSGPFVMRAGANGVAVLFRYGVAVLMGLNPIEETTFLNTLQDFIIDPYSEPEVEESAIRVDPNQAEGVENDYIRLKTWDIAQLQMVADIFAKSAVLSFYEERMADTFDRIDLVAAELQTGKISGRRTRDLLRHIGMTLSIQRKMVGQVEIDEKPEILWENPELERLFLRLEDEYELSERHEALKQKLDLVYKTAETMLGLQSNKRTLHVEWYIVILIVIEIIITLGEKFLHW
ncbi:MAG: RMD1 family protein [Rhodospirillales bacterium]|nr:RMD1 family protein [Rhodospirillales bacterium]MCB9996754.1 RMD1 family protein [Rhodospirillales bacterium]